MKRAYRSTAITWAGDDLSFELYTEACQKFFGMTPAQAGVVLAPGEDRTEGASAEVKSRLLQVQDGVALINIAGVLTSQNNWWNAYAGLVSYDEIREAVHEAASHEASQVLVYFNSPGGSVAGLKDAVDSMTSLSKLKPTYGYTDSQATSAAYWLMAATRKRFVSDVATVGSIGVLAKHFEFSKQLQEDGVGATVVRAGEFKALANEIEPLSDKGRQELQDDVNYLYGVFVGSVAELLDTSYQRVDSKMAQGRTFIGAQGVEVGLVDGVSSFDELYATLIKKAAAKDATGGSPMKKKISMSAALAAISAGAPPEALDVTPAPDATGGEQTPGESGGAPEAGEASSAEAQTPEPGAEAPAPSASAPAPDESEVVALLKSQLAEANVDLVDARAEQKNLAKKLEASEAIVGPMKTIVAQSVNNMLVALGGTAEDSLASLDAKALVERHAAVSNDFTKNFRIGGVASVQADTHEPETKTSAPSPVERARMRLVKPAHNTK